MSDGPFKSWHMRKGWCEVAERTDNSNFADDAIGKALEPALKGDFDIEIAPQLLAGIKQELENAAQRSLFEEDKSASGFGALKREAAGFPLADLLVDCAIQAAGERDAPEPSLVGALANALSEWCARHIKGVEEHSLREKLDMGRRQQIRRRLESAHSATNFNELARQFLKLGEGAAPRTPPKQGGLDDGVPINGAP